MEGGGGRQMTGQADFYLKKMEYSKEKCVKTAATNPLIITKVILNVMDLNY